MCRAVIRTCVGCRTKQPKDVMLRVSRIGGSPNIGGHGRGAYICRSAKCLELAFRRSGLARSLALDPNLPSWEVIRQTLLSQIQEFNA